MIWAGRSAASDGFVDMLNTAQFALTASNDIRNASSTNARQPPLAVVFFTNRIMASVPQHEVSLPPPPWVPAWSPTPAPPADCGPHD